MLRSSDLNHEYFEELCALAALGRISKEEHEELLPHLRLCTSCRVRYSEFMEILHEHLPLLDPQREVFADSPNVSFHDSSYKHRFIRRARERGIVFNDSDSATAPRRRRSAGPRNARRWIGELFWPPSFQRYALVTALVVSGMAFGWIGSRSLGDHSTLTDSQVETSRLMNELADLHQRIRELSRQSSYAKQTLSEPK